MPRPKKPKAPEEYTITVVVDGVSHVVRPGDISALDAGTLRRQTGMSVRAVLQAVTEDPDVDIIASLVWLARRQAGEKSVEWDTVAAEITYDSDIRSDDAPADDEDDSSPEA